MIPKRPTHGRYNDQEWLEHYYEVAKRAVEALREVVEGMQVETSDHEFVGELAEDALRDIAESGWKE